MTDEYMNVIPFPTLERMAEQLDKHHGYLTKIIHKVDQLDTRMDALETSVNELKARMETRFDRMDTRLNLILEKLSHG